MRMIDKSTFKAIIDVFKAYQRTLERKIVPGSGADAQVFAVFHSMTVKPQYVIVNWKAGKGFYAIRSYILRDYSIRFRYNFIRSVN